MTDSILTNSRLYLSTCRSALRSVGRSAGTAMLLALTLPGASSPLMAQGKTPAPAPTSAPARQSDRYTAAVIRSAPVPGVRLSSGLVVAEEELRNGHWVNRYWTSTGQIRPSGQAAHDSTADAFRLAIEGQDLAGTWRWVKATQARVRHPEGLVVTVELTSSARPITVRVHTLLTGGPALVRWLEIVNTGPTATAITAVSPWAGRVWTTNAPPDRLAADETPYEVATTKYLKNSMEGSWTFDTLRDGTKTIVSNHGRSGWGHPTFFAHNRVTGEWAIASLAWSTNWAMQVHGGAEFTFELGPHTVDEALRVIDAGETVKSPETHLLLVRGDLDAAIQALHAHVRRNVLPPPIPGREYQVETNHRGYIAGHEDEPGMKREVDIAAAVGAELFMIDAGWYGPEPNDWDNHVGDWYAGKWLPNDLQPIRAYARKKGLLFGLWAEIEGIGIDTKLRAQHPDWVATRAGQPYLPVAASNGQPLTYGRVLDFANPAAAAWAESEIARMIKTYDLDMFRLDHNYYLGDGASRRYQGFVENTEWRHVETLYAMFDRLRQRFPRVIFQNCASGGGRLDFGMMHRFDNTEISESMRPPAGLKVLNGVTWVLPPEVLLRTFGTEAGGLENDGDLDFQLQHVMMARPIFRGISPSIAELNPLTARAIRHALARFKQTVRPIMIGSRVYHHTPVLPFEKPSPWAVLEYAAPAGNRAVVGLFRIGASGDSVYHLMPRGLDFSRTYRVHFGSTGQVVEFSGAALQQMGLPIRLENNLSSELLTFEAKP